MSEIKCPRCGRSLASQTGAAFCPYCGGSLSQPAASADSEEVRALLRKASEASDPRKKHELLEQAKKLAPDSLAVTEELLHLGRLHERNPRKLDYSVIKCYLLQTYLEPDELDAETNAAFRREFFHHPLVEECLRLTDQPEVFLSRYLTRMCSEFISLFLRGNSRYMHRIFGLGIDSRGPKYLASPVAGMLARIRQDETLTAEERSLLSHALYAAYAQDANGDTQYLAQKLDELGFSID